MVGFSNQATGFMDLIDEIFGGGTTDYYFGGQGMPGQSGPGYAYGVTGVPVFNAYPGGNPIISTGIQGAIGLASGLIQQSKAAGAQKAAQEKAINARWGQLVQQALAVFTAVSARLPNITADDLAAAQNAYNALAAFVAQYPTDYVVRQWQSDAYQGAALADLQKYQAALSSVPTSNVASSSNPAAAAGTTTSQLAATAASSSSSFLGGLVSTLESNPILSLVILLGTALWAGKTILGKE